VSLVSACPSFNPCPLRCCCSVGSPVRFAPLVLQLTGRAALLCAPCAVRVQGRDSLFDNVRSCGVDPRSIAQRIMDIRTQLSEEFIQELQAIAEENSVLLRWVNLAMSSK